MRRNSSNQDYGLVSRMFLTITTFPGQIKLGKNGEKHNLPGVSNSDGSQPIYTREREVFLTSVASYQSFLPAVYLVSITVVSPKLHQKAAPFHRHTGTDHRLPRRTHNDIMSTNDRTPPTDGRQHSTP